MRRSTSVRALLIALLLCVALPAAIDAASPAAATPLNTNLLLNPGFNQAPTTGHPVPGWYAGGDIHTETFGTRAWPTVAYGQKWGGGTRYLTCSKVSGFVTQAVAFTGWSTRSFTLLARLTADWGGQIGTSIKLTVRITGGTQLATKDKTKVTDITNSYRKNVVTLAVPTWATKIQATLQIFPKAGASKCNIVADTTSLTVIRG